MLVVIIIVGRISEIHCQGELNPTVDLLYIIIYDYYIVSIGGGEDIHV